jgi:hypothetical protein
MAVNKRCYLIIGELPAGGKRLGDPEPIGLQ